MKRVLLSLVVVLVLLLALGGWVMGRSITAPRLWKTAKIDRGELRVTISASGRVEPLRSVQVGSQVSGKVTEVLVEPDQGVAQGQVLARLASDLLESERNDREIRLAQAQAGLAMLEEERGQLDLRAARQKLEAERAGVAVDQATARLSLAEKNLSRNQEVKRLGGQVSEADLDIRVLERESSAHEVRLRRLDLEQHGLDERQLALDRNVLEQRLRQSKLAVRQAEEELSKAKANLSFALIVAPIEGLVLERSVDPGQTIAAQFQTPNLFRIVSSLKRIRIQTQIDEADVARIRSGQKVSFEVDAFRNEKFEGAVTAVRLKEELRANLVTYPVLLEAENPASESFPNGKLRPGMTAYLTFEVEQKPDVLRVPAEALRFAPPEGVAVSRAAEPAAAEKETAPAKNNGKGGKKPHGLPATVYVAREDSTLEPRSILVGESDGEHFELLGGTLSSGDEVVTAPAGGAGELSQQPQAAEQD